MVSGLRSPSQSSRSGGECILFMFFKKSESEEEENSCVKEIKKLLFRSLPVVLYPFPVTASLVSLPLTNSFSSSLYRDWIDDVGICVGSDGGGDTDVGGDDDEAVQCSSHEQ
uniref:Uncharacterized protein n=1 Tax=Glossina pallidipes TaxID=7398 RepID=A0A1B0AJB0_GLOPL